MMTVLKNIISYKWHTSDYVTVGLLLSPVLMIMLSNIDIPYTWQWSMILGYVVYVDDGGSWHAGLILHGLMNTFRLFFLSIIIGLGFGFILTFMRMSKNVGFNILGTAYVNFVRNIPPLVFLFIFYFFISEQIFPKLGLTTDLLDNVPVLALLFGESIYGVNMISAGICLGLFEAAFFAEILRGSLNAIAEGQSDAGRALGLSWLQRMRLILAPQAFLKSYPALAGQSIVALKNTSIASLVSVRDLVFSGHEVVTSTRTVFEAWIIVAVVYFVLCYAMTKVFARWETQLEKSRL